MKLVITLHFEFHQKLTLLGRGRKQNGRGVRGTKLGGGGGIYRLPAAREGAQSGLPQKLILDLRVVVLERQGVVSYLGPGFSF